MIKRLLQVFAIIPLFSLQAADAPEKQQGLVYQCWQENGHIIHILSVDPKHYKLQVTKAGHQVLGREPLDIIAGRTPAVAAINAGFFEIGPNKEGRPSGMLVIDREIFTLPTGAKDLLVIKDDKVDIIQASGKVSLKVRSGEITPHHINCPPQEKNVVFYTSAWGTRSLTPYQRKEILIDSSGKILDIINHGNNPIPARGWIVSLPMDYPLPALKVGEKVQMVPEFVSSDQQRIDVDYAVMGIPMIVDKGQPTSATQVINSFTIHPHARTAVGVHKDGRIIFVVAENTYAHSIRTMTLEQAKAALHEQDFSAAQIESMTLGKMRMILEQQAQPSTKIIGLTIPGLAELMIQIGCEKAINLDGGGSSTFYLNGRIMNTPIGDEDEAAGEVVARPISDALLVIPRTFKEE